MSYLIRKATDRGWRLYEVTCRMNNKVKKPILVSTEIHTYERGPDRAHFVFTVLCVMGLALSFVIRR